MEGVEGERLWAPCCCTAELPGGSRRLLVPALRHTLHVGWPCMDACLGMWHGMLAGGVSG